MRAATGWVALPYTSSRVEAFQLRSRDEIEVPLGQKSVRENWSFASSGLDHFPLPSAALRLGIGGRVPLQIRDSSSDPQTETVLPVCPEMGLLPVNRMPALLPFNRGPRRTTLGESGKKFIETGKQAECRDAILLEGRSVNPALGRLRRNNAEAKTRKK